MCRWIAYRGETTALEHYVTEPEHSLISQSLRALESTAGTNGDGFGLGWYGQHPGLTRICAIFAAISNRICSSRMCAPPPARRSRGRTVIRSPAGDGCSCITVLSEAGTGCAGKSRP